MEPLIICEDGLFNINVLLSGDFEVLKINASVYRYVNNETSVTRTFAVEKSRKCLQSLLDYTKNVSEIMDKHEDDITIQQRLIWVQNKNIPNIFSRMHHSQLSYSRVREIVKLLRLYNCLPVDNTIDRDIKFKAAIIDKPCLFYSVSRLLTLIGKK